MLLVVLMVKHILSHSQQVSQMTSQIIYPWWAMSDAYPNLPTRSEVLSVNMHFRGGLIVDSPIYGKMPWWPTALSWCDPVTRNNAYIEMGATGDTHAIIQIPNGLPLYDESGQFYSPDRFPALDWTNGETKIDGRLS